MPMNIIIITQNDPFYLGKYLDYLFSNMPDFAKIAGIIILDFSPFGKAESIFKRIRRIYQVFGLYFFVRYLCRYLYIMLFNRKYLIKFVINKYNIEEIVLPNNNLNSPESINYIKKIKPDLIISISANQIFKKELLDLPRYRCLNLHTALLPKYKGLMPAFWALKNDEPEAGVSVFFIDEGIDTGDILVQKTIPIEPDDTLDKLIHKTKKLGMDSLLRAINMIESKNLKTFKPSGEGSYYTFPTNKDVREFINAGKKFW